MHVYQAGRRLLIRRKLVLWRRVHGTKKGRVDYQGGGNKIIQVDTRRVKKRNQKTETEKIEKKEHAQGKT